MWPGTREKDRANWRFKRGRQREKFKLNGRNNAGSWVRVAFLGNAQNDYFVRAEQMCCVFRGLQPKLTGFVGGGAGIAPRIGSPRASQRYSSVILTLNSP